MLLVEACCSPTYHTCRLDVGGEEVRRGVQEGVMAGVGEGFQFVVFKTACSFEWQNSRWSCSRVHPRGQRSGPYADCAGRCVDDQPFHVEIIAPACPAQHRSVIEYLATRRLACARAIARASDFGSTASRRLSSPTRATPPSSTSQQTTRGHSRPDIYRCVLLFACF
ncbi:hypothetical protein BU16DRAFT_219980 [Lophium mytilinum]|uniref:Uncharacterized protein n=1 Tax=Lophium mytilinum TaxID=390894 RepID=A0A6A6Q9T5_9PEZI|nr:hypothetical protein BU16DRAFT_219980 [Lophium mytilinum]